MWLLRAQMIDNLQMNFVSTAMMCKAVIPGMKERGFGRIINMVTLSPTKRHSVASSGLRRHVRSG